MVDALFHPLAGFALAALLLGAAVRTGTVPLTPRTVLAAAPWAVVAAGVAVAERAGVYAVLAPTPTSAGLLAAVAVLAVGGWLGTALLADLREVPFRERYLAVAGFAAATVVVVSLFAYVDLVALRLVWVLLVPVVAGLSAAAGYFVLGLVYTDALVELRVAGLYVVATVVLDGAASAAAVEALGRAEVGFVPAAVAAAVDAVGVSVSAWLLLPLYVLVGVVLAGVCGWLARRRGPLGNGCALVVSVAALCSATTVLLSAVLLG